MITTIQSRKEFDDSVSQGLSLHRYSETLVLHLRFVTVGKKLGLNDIINLEI